MRSKSDCCVDKRAGFLFYSFVRRFVATICKYLKCNFSTSRLVNCKKTYMVSDGTRKRGIFDEANAPHLCKYLIIIASTNTHTHAGKREPVDTDFFRHDHIIDTFKSVLYLKRKYIVYGQIDTRTLRQSVDVYEFLFFKFLFVHTHS